MLVQELLTQLKEKGIVIRLGENGDLAVTAPKGAMTADFARRIKENKQGIVAFLGVSAANETLAAFPPITHVDRGRFVPISLAQERLWWLEQMSPGLPVYNLLHAYRLRGALDVAALEAALNQVVNRHEALHMHFDMIDCQPVGVIMENYTVTLPLVSLEDSAAETREEALQTKLREFDMMPFDLTDWPLFRAVLFRLAPDEHVFLFLVHHIVFDGWSADVFWDDLVLAYDAEISGETPSWPPLDIQYVDFAAWQRDWLNSPAAENELAFWREGFAEPVEALKLPVSRHATSNLPYYEAQQQTLTIPPDLAKQVKAVAQRYKATPFMVLLAAYRAALHAYSGQTDVIVCTPVARRTTPDLEAAVGYFNNIVALRSDLGGDPTFAQLLAQEKQVVLAANDHQATPFQHVADMPALQQVPLMRSLFVVQNPARSLPDLSGISATPVTVQRQYDYADLSVELREKDGGFSGALWFKSALFDAANLQAFTENYLTILTLVTQDAERPLSSLPRFEMPVVVGEAGREKRPFSPPRNQLEAEMAAIWGDLLGYEPVSVFDDFFEVGGHSLLAMRLFAQLEKVTGKTLPLSLLFRAPTIAGLAELIRADDIDLPHASIVTIAGQSTNGVAESKRPFYCVTPPGDELLIFAALAREMGKKRPFLGLQYGVNGEPPIMTVPDMAAYFVQQILDQDSHEPYLLGGYCFGGLLAYEMAQQLTALGKAVALVAMIDTAVPNFVNQRKNTWREMVNNGVAVLQEEGVAAEMQHIVNRTADRLKLDVWHPIWGKIQKRYVEKNEALPGALRNYDFINLQAENAYQVEPYAGDVVLLQAAEQNPIYEYPPHLGWDKFVEDRLADHTVPGEHRTILEDPFVEELAAILNQAVDAAEKEKLEIKDWKLAGLSIPNL